MLLHVISSQKQATANASSTALVTASVLMFTKVQELTRSTTPLAVGNILTIEPGIYIEGKFGVRIEDMLYFGENGTENLTHMPKELIIIK